MAAKHQEPIDSDTISAVDEQQLTFALQRRHCPVLDQQPAQQQATVCEQSPQFFTQRVCLARKGQLLDGDQLLPQVTQDCSLAVKRVFVCVRQRKSAGAAVATGSSGCEAEGEMK